MSCCEACKVRFTVLKRKKNCSDCLQLYCAHCAPKLQSGTGRRCQRCQFLVTGTFTRSDLQQYRARELRNFLSKRGVTVDFCREKGDLIERLLQFANNTAYREEKAADERHRQHLQEQARVNLRSPEPPTDNRPFTFPSPPSYQSVLTSDETESAENTPSQQPRVPQDQFPQQPTSSEQTQQNLSSQNPLLRDQSSNNPLLSESEAQAETMGSSPSRNQTKSDSRQTANQKRARDSSSQSYSTSQQSNIPPSPSTDQSNVSEFDIRENHFSADSRNNGVGNTQGSPYRGVNTEGTGGVQEQGDTQTNPPVSGTVSQLQGGGGQSPRKKFLLSDVTNEEDIQTLSVAQLKELLQRNFVDYRGCVERHELVTRVTRLWRTENLARNSAPETKANETIEKTPSGHAEVCKICMDAPVNCVLLDCGHMLTCTDCGRRLAECPICRQFVVRVIHVFRS